ncbi:2-(3-amino-3-carboxypropyl)histidine synthase subunit 2 [Coccinella septempunctata]|uniref:2-(3-amino-3-carboxypropyl)histidine synthase subunit 2 n=1 Tax=Coccinella septempunctata TaxID=41139 RepID=UPI001D07BA3C|nr:2-(3-amino-3-carboxypropyl)histidine synthase subunit 2 [Coccinella septempunctata]
MSLFFTHEQVSLEKNVDTKVIIENEPEKIRGLYEIDRCVSWIKTNNFRRVCLQFPDHLLPDSVEVVFKLQEALDQPVYLMGDTAYESCCLDFIAAGHIEADALIHFGSICFSQSAKKLPYLNIYEKHDIDIKHLVKSIETFLAGKDKTEIYLLVDTPFIHVLDSIQEYVPKNSNVNVLRLDMDIDYSKTGFYIFIGNNSRKMENIIFSLDEQNLYQYDPSASSEIVNFKENPAILKRRYYLSEKIKDSQTFGIVMGTLAVDNYLKVLSRMKKLLKLNKKKFYVLSVGKISVAKLANFPEMDVFIVITCAMNEVYDSKEFYKPIVTPFDVEKAFNPESQSLKFTYDYNSFLKSVSDSCEIKPLDEPDVSLLTGRMRSNQSEDSEGTTAEENNEISLKSNGVLVENSKFGAGYLANRSWTGLEQNLGQTEIQLAKEGRRGIAQFYSNEIAGEENS